MTTEKQKQKCQQVYEPWEVRNWKENKKVTIEKIKRNIKPSLST